MENLKNIAPIEDFNWDAYENGDATTTVSKEDLEKAYDSTPVSYTHLPTAINTSHSLVFTFGPRFPCMPSIPLFRR